MHINCLGMGVVLIYETAMAFVFLEEILSAFPRFETGRAEQLVSTVSDESLPAWFDVTGLAASSIAAAGLMLAPDRHLTVDRRYASVWFGMSLRPDSWKLPPVWDPVAGDYQTKNGWIRLHTNAPHHRHAALSVLGHYQSRLELEPIVAQWDSGELETAIVEADGCAAEMRGLGDWHKHPQGIAVSREPLVHWQAYNSVEPSNQEINPARPLEHIRILDLTRVLAGPVAGRFLAAYGADVLRIDPPDWEEPSVIPEVTLGKRCAGLNLKLQEDRMVFENLLSGADILLHGYRPGALDGLGYNPEDLRRINPSLIDVSLSAYGWTGPWSRRRGFDSLVQMSTGIADYGMTMSHSDRPVPLPVQALDHATGYLIAAAALYALEQRTHSGSVLSARLSLARTADLLISSKRDKISGGMSVETDSDISPEIENTAWGPARRIKFPLEVEGIPASWDYPAGQLRTSPATWK